MSDLENIEFRSLQNLHNNFNVENCISKFQPLFVFHPEEEYFPVRFKDYLKECSLYKYEKNSDFKRKCLAKTLTPRTLFELSDQATSQSTLAINNPKHNPIVYGSVNCDQLLVHVYEGDCYFYIQYIPYYAYNGSTMVCSCIPAGRHQADLENVIAIVSKDNYKLIGYNLSHHGDQTFYHLDDLIKCPVTEKYKIYVSKYSHAHYPRPKNYRRFWGAVYDRTGEGQTWFPDVFRIYDPEDEGFVLPTMGFTAYTGDLGDTHVSSFKSQGFWKKDFMNF